MEGYTYILRCADGSFYTGSTVDIEKRLLEHQAGEGGVYTRKRLPVELVYWEQHQTIEQAFEREQQIKRWKRVKKEALVAGNFEILPVLAKKVWRKKY